MSRPLLQVYYLATPLFAALDVASGVSVRAAGLERLSHRLAWYGGAFLLGLAMRARPTLAPWLGMGESVANLVLLMLAVLVPVWSLADGGDPAGAADLPARVGNLALSGSVLLFAFYRYQAEALGPPRREPLVRPPHRSLP